MMGKIPWRDPVATRLQQSDREATPNDPRCRASWTELAPSPEGPAAEHEFDRGDDRERDPIDWPWPVVAGVRSGEHRGCSIRDDFGGPDV